MVGIASLHTYRNHLKRHVSFVAVLGIFATAFCNVLERWRGQCIERGRGGEANVLREAEVERSRWRGRGGEVEVERPRWRG